MFFPFRHLPPNLVKSQPCDQLSTLLSIIFTLIIQPGGHSNGCESLLMANLVMVPAFLFPLFTCVLS